MGLERLKLLTNTARELRDISQNILDESKQYNIHRSDFEHFYPRFPGGNLKFIKQYGALREQQKREYLIYLEKHRGEGVLNEDPESIILKFVPLADDFLKKHR